MKFRKNKKGFTLIEAILSIMLLSVGMVGVLTLFQNNVSRSNESEITMIGTYLAQEKLEQFMQNKHYSGYNAMLNYNSAENNIAGHAGYTRTTTSRAVSPGDLTSNPGGGASEQGYMRVTCVVTTPMGDNITLETIATNWGG